MITCQKESVDQNAAGQTNIESIMSANSPEEAKESIVLRSVGYNNLPLLFRRHQLTFSERASILFFVPDRNRHRRLVDIFFNRFDLLRNWWDYCLGFLLARMRTFFFFNFIFTGGNRYVVFEKFHLLSTLLLFFGVLSLRVLINVIESIHDNSENDIEQKE